MIKRYLAMIEERHIRYASYVVGFIILGFLVMYFIKEDKEAQKRHKDWLAGCGGQGKAHSGLGRVSVFFSEGLFDEYRQQLVGSLVGEGILKDDQDSLRRFRENQPAFRKLLEEKRVYFSVEDDTQVKFINKSNEGITKIQVLILDGPYQGYSGWLEAGQYWCLDWQSPKSDSKGSIEEIFDKIIKE